MSELDDVLTKIYGFVVIVPCVGSFLIGGWVLANEVWYWLQFAAWPGTTLREGLLSFSGQMPHGDTGALGVDKLIEWCLDQALPLALMVGFPLGWGVLGTFLFEVLTRRRASF
jgi:hypothetical protein